MVWTLQWYIFRELGKTFLLTAIGMTVVLAMGGGVLNIIDLQQVTAVLLLEIMKLVVPLGATLALPVAALFSAAVTYGRLSADNEFVACRASGINIHVLFLPTLVISLVSAGFTFFSLNYLFPQQLRNLYEIGRADPVRMVQYQLQAPRRLPLGDDRVRIYAEEVQVVSDEESGEHSKELLTHGVAFVQLDGENWVLYGTAGWARIRFDHLDTEPSGRADLFDVLLINRMKDQVVSLAQQPLWADQLPRNLPLKAKWLSLNQLFYYRPRPYELPEVDRTVQRVRGALAKEYFYRSLRDDFAVTDQAGQPDCKLILGDAKASYEVEADALTPDVQDYRPSLAGNVRVTERRGDQVRTIRANRGTIDIARSGAEFGKAYLTLFGRVEVADPWNPAFVVPKPRLELDPVALPETILGQVGSIPVERLLDPETEIPGLRDVREARAAAVNKCAAVVRQITREIHSRLAFSVSVFVLVILAAALGIILRGSHALTAFGISFVPSFLVIVLIIMGRQLAQNPGTILLGLGTIWAGIVLVGGLDVWTLTRVLKR
ncbi:MAG TPA: LptF/LptG family permease [Phycisphaerae bacterium]|nr:LptF/LptG family permease [Phycisphaerae bacterium]